MKSRKLIAGVDEVGRGSLVGAVFSAAVIFKPDTCIKNLKDWDHSIFTLSLLWTVATMLWMMQNHSAVRSYSLSPILHIIAAKVRSVLAQ